MLIETHLSYGSYEIDQSEVWLEEEWGRDSFGPSLADSSFVDGSNQGRIAQLRGIQTGIEHDLATRFKNAYCNLVLEAVSQSDIELKKQGIGSKNHGAIMDTP